MSCKLAAGVQFFVHLLSRASTPNKKTTTNWTTELEHFRKK